MLRFCVSKRKRRYFVNDKCCSTKAMPSKELKQWKQQIRLNRFVKKLKISIENLEIYEEGMAYIGDLKPVNYRPVYVLIVMFVKLLKLKKQIECLPKCIKGRIHSYIQHILTEIIEQCLCGPEENKCLKNIVKTTAYIDNVFSKYLPTKCFEFDWCKSKPEKPDSKLNLITRQTSRTFKPEKADSKLTLITRETSPMEITQMISRQTSPLEIPQENKPIIPLMSQETQTDEIKIESKDYEWYESDGDGDHTDLYKSRETIFKQESVPRLEKKWHEFRRSIEEIDLPFDEIFIIDDEGIPTKVKADEFGNTTEDDKPVFVETKVIHKMSTKSKEQTLIYRKNENRPKVIEAHYVITDNQPTLKKAVKYIHGPKHEPRAEEKFIYSTNEIGKPVLVKYIKFDTEDEPSIQKREIYKLRTSSQVMDYEEDSIEILQDEEEGEAFDQKRLVERHYYQYKENKLKKATKVSQKHKSKSEEKFIYSSNEVRKPVIMKYTKFEEVNLPKGQTYKLRTISTQTAEDDDDDDEEEASVEIIGTKEESFVENPYIKLRSVRQQTDKIIIKRDSILSERVRYSVIEDGRITAKVEKFNNEDERGEPILCEMEFIVKGDGDKIRYGRQVAYSLKNNIQILVSYDGKESTSELLKYTTPTRDNKSVLVDNEGYIFRGQPIKYILTKENNAVFINDDGHADYEKTPKYVLGSDKNPIFLMHIEEDQEYLEEEDQFYEVEVADKTTSIEKLITEETQTDECTEFAVMSIKYTKIRTRNEKTKEEMEEICDSSNYLEQVINEELCSLKNEDTIRKYSYKNFEGEGAAQMEIIKSFMHKGLEMKYSTDQNQLKRKKKKNTFEIPKEEVLSYTEKVMNYIKSLASAMLNSTDIK